MFPSIPLGYIKLIVWTMLQAVARVFRVGMRGLYTAVKSGISLMGNINISCALVQKAQLVSTGYHVNQGL